MWQKLEAIDPRRFEPAEQQLHWAAQFIAMAGQSYLPPQPDDRHTNMGWEAGTQRICGRILRQEGVNVQVGIDVPGFRLMLMEENGQQLAATPLEGRTREELRQWLEVQLAHLGMPALPLSYIDHYDLPDHPLARGAVFQKPESDLLEAWMALRTNAQALLRNVAAAYPTASEVRIWPHHFDTGVYIPLRQNEEGTDTHVLGAGLAMTDQVANEPYLYVFGWMKNGSIDYGLMPMLEYGRWSKGDWKGAYLAVNRWVIQADQETAGRRFLTDSMAHLRKAMGENE